MNINEDYISSSEDEFIQGNSYVRPIFIKLSKNLQTKSTKRSNKIEKNTSIPNSNKMHESNIKLVFSDTKSKIKDILKTKDNINNHSKNTNGNSKFFREYGDGISGYKYIIPENDYIRLKEKEDKKIAEEYDSDEGEKVDILKYDSLPNITATRLRSVDIIHDYWAKSNNNFILPLLRGSSIENTEIEEINKDSVVEFYEASYTHSIFDFRTIIKEERVRWHPDKLASRISDRDKNTDNLLPKITKLFQIINDIWESL